MKSRIPSGKCKLCGKETILTYEHVPPETAFNSSSVKKYPFDQTIKTMIGSENRFPWDFEGLYGKINQRGSGGYYLCKQCNNITGSWYMSSYVTFTKTIHDMIMTEKLQPGDRRSFIIYSMYPLRLFKAIMTMFCDINNNCFGDEQLKNYLLEKESQNLNLSKYKIYLTLVSPQMRRIQGLSAVMNCSEEPALITEVASYPIGCMLCIDKPDWYTPAGLLINDWATCSFDDKCNIEFIGMPYYDINIQMPGDFRTKEELRRTNN